MAHYQRWPFPGLDHAGREGLVLQRHLTRRLGPPDVGPASRVADVGCGTGHTTLALARHFPHVRFVGIDIASRAVEAAAALAAERGVENATFTVGDLTEGVTRFGRFDVVLCLGVLHHVPDMPAAFAHLSDLMNPGADLLLWLYGRHGRCRHVLNRRFLRMITTGCDAEQRLSAAQRFVDEFGDRLVAGSGVYTPVGDGPAGVTWLGNHSEWLADQFLTPVEHQLALEDILCLFDAHGLEFRGLLGVSSCPDRHVPDLVLRHRLERMEARDRALAIDLLLRPSSYFATGRRPRAP